MATNLLATTTLSGCWQMALDAALLEQRQPVLRFYRWSRPTLSLGYHQASEPHWLNWQQQGGGDLVRRPTGGGAVVHDGDLCYALIWPDPPGSRHQAYQQVCGWLQHAFAQLGEPLHFGDERAAAGGDCFARSTAADLLNADGHKRIGSAQRWQRGCLLQHGSIQLKPTPERWQLLLGRPAPQLAPLALGAEELAEHLLEHARRWLALPYQALPLPAALLSLAGEQLERYRCCG
ncbi:MAG: lipoate--protein ligase family protein [Prochlorococcaceae cyanobacterium]|jgi:lipoate-protein ligase A